MQSFSSTTINIELHDKIYLFSDGFADQFGGKKHKKIGLKRFKKLILDSSTHPLSKQKNIMTEYLNKWQNNKPQIDDITVFGLSIKN
jgi:serine phosphatase RsbU (regulator of sigma subunit)